MLRLLWHFISYFQFSIFNNVFHLLKNKSSSSFQVKLCKMNMSEHFDWRGPHHPLSIIRRQILTNNKMKLSIWFLSLELPGVYCSDAYQFSEEIIFTKCNKECSKHDENDERWTMMTMNSTNEPNTDLMYRVSRHKHHFVMVKIVKSCLLFQSFSWILYFGCQYFMRFCIIC